MSERVRNERERERNSLPITSARNPKQISHSNLFQNNTNLVLFVQMSIVAFRLVKMKVYRTNTVRRQGGSANIPNYMLFMLPLITLQENER